MHSFLGHCKCFSIKWYVVGTHSNCQAKTTYNWYSQHTVITPVYEVCREYIVFAFSVCVFVCKLFFVKDFSATT